VKDFDTRLAYLRKERGISQQKLAEDISRIGRIKVGRAAVSAWETGIRTPHRETIELLADYFNVDLAYLMGASDSQTSDFPEITLIARAGQRMTKDQRELMLKWAKLTFPDAFADSDQGDS